MVKFGTGGWRAIIGDEFVKTNVVKVAHAIALMMKDENVAEKGIVIGYDRRFLSDVSARWICEVFAGNGIKAFLIDKEAPTPIIMFGVKQLETPYGMAVTASHNPAAYNGIKVFVEGGRDSDVCVTDKIEAYIDQLEDTDSVSLEFQEGLQQGLIQRINPFNEYIDTILSMLDCEAIRSKHLKIALDPMFGVSKTSLQTILMSARCEVDIINDRHDTMFGGRLPSPSAQTLSRLSNLVSEKGYDLGIGTDGDADRLGIIDEHGNFIHPNKIMALLYYYLIEYKGWKGPIVRNLATTHLLDAIAIYYHETCYEVPVGFKHISSKMAETDAILGGESSGGLTIKGHVKGKDGIFAAGLLVEMICVTGKRLADLLLEIDQKFGNFEMVEANLNFHPKEKNRLIDLLYTQKLVPDFGIVIKDVSYLDGVKVYFDNGGWIIARFSGTEPLIRIFAEQASEEKAEALVAIFKEFLRI
jgi:phosphomannomutase